MLLPQETFREVAHLSGQVVFAMLEIKDVFTIMPAVQNREWLETNGLGGFASSSLIGANLRRYHGLLVAALHPPAGRAVLLSKFEEALIVDGERYEFSTNQYGGGTIHPMGFQYFRRFRLDPFPIFTFEIRGIEIEKSIFMVFGENTTVIQYRIMSLPERVEECRLELRPLIAYRDYHALTHANPVLRGELALGEGQLSIQPYEGMPTLHLAHNAARVESNGSWFYNFEYGIEKDRGLDFNEDLFSPAALTFDLIQDSVTATVIASTAPHNVADASVLKKAEIERRKRVAGAPVKGDISLLQYSGLLKSAADQFIVQRGAHRTVIAGYHWFSDWGRDTMISLPGLTLSTGRDDIAKEILFTFADSVSEGMLPNRFPDTGEAPEFNTVDATLWFFHAAYLYLERSKDKQFVRTKLYPVFKEIIEWHLRGTRHGIKVDGDGLLAGGVAGVQLTWMDARVGDWVVTPRHGKPVEIQALWYNALRVMETLAALFDDVDGCMKYGAMAEQVKIGFNQRFWNESGGCLYDVVNGETRDASIRPNQIFAVSLPFTMLDRERSQQVVATVEQHLLTPCGLRTLAPSDPAYKGRYEGGVNSRDGAYHQGTAWPWLLGPFITAYLKTHGYTAAARSHAEKLLRPIVEQLTEAGVGQLSEVYDGDSPQRPGGCMAQAWSVAEILRCLLEELGRNLPQPGKPAATTRRRKTVTA
jgi:predicted glycogen debranching enzyme